MVLFVCSPGFSWFLSFYWFFFFTSMLCFDCINACRPQYASGEVFVIYTTCDHHSSYKTSVTQPGSRNTLSQAKHSFAQCAPCIDKARLLKIGTGWVMPLKIFVLLQKVLKPEPLELQGDCPPTQTPQSSPPPSRPILLAGLSNSCCSDRFCAEERWKMRKTPASARVLWQR